MAKASKNGKLSRQDLEQLQADSPRKSMKLEKISFVLWKMSKENRQIGASPWGAGRQVGILNVRL